MKPFMFRQNKHVFQFIRPQFFEQFKKIAIIAFLTFSCGSYSYNVRAEIVINGTPVWRGWYQVLGYSQSGQEVCDKVQALLGYSGSKKLTYMTYLPAGPDGAIEAGQCVYSRGQQVSCVIAFGGADPSLCVASYAVRAYSCPKGFLPKPPYDGSNNTNVYTVYYGENVKCSAPYDSNKDSNQSANGQVCNADGNPINRMSGIKRQYKTDLKLGTLSFKRTYSSHDWWVANPGSLGIGWNANILSRKIALFLTSTPAQAWAVRGNSNQVIFRNSGSIWTPDADIKSRLIEVTDGAGVRTGWKYYDALTEDIELYDNEGIFASVTTKDGKTTTINQNEKGQTIITDYQGKSLTFTYDASGRIIKMTDPSGADYIYTYGTYNNLSSVTYPDGKSREYHYENISYPNALTGITDENEKRYATFVYDNNGKATQTKHLTDDIEVEKYTLSGYYTSPIVTDPLGTSRTYKYEIKNNTPLQTSQSQPSGSGCEGASSALTYDENGNVASRTDFNGNVTTYTYDLTRNLEMQRVEASGKAEAKTVSTSWHSYWRLPIKVAEPKKLTIYKYNGDDGEYCAPTDATVPSIDGGTQSIGVLCQKTEQATTDVNGSQGLNPTVSGSARVWKYTYDRYGHVLTATDPNNHVTTNTYYAIDDASIGNRGNLHTSTNAAGHVTTYSNYDANGRVGTIVDANGLTTTLTYSPRGWLTSKVVTGGGTTESTTYTYDGVGQMTKVSLPDGAEITYTYDDAHRLTAITDKAGNSIHYTLDAMGNRTKEEVKDPTGNLSRQVTRVYDALNRLEAITGGGV